MPFGLCTAASAFQAMINEVLHNLRDLGVMEYLDDILIYPETDEEHKDLAKKVQERLREANLHAHIDKSFYHQQEVEDLGYHISEDGISVSKEKVYAIRE